MKRSRLFRLIWILFAIWIVMLGVLYFTGSKYRNHVIALLKSQIDSRLNTEIQIKKDDIHFSLLRNFPNASLHLRNVLVKSSPQLHREDFKFPGSDTLLFSEEFSFVFNIGSILTKSFEVKGIHLNNAKLNILYDKEGNRNFDVLVRNDSVPSNPLSLTLREIKIKNTEIAFIDLGAEVEILSKVKRSVLEGNFSGESFKLATNSDISGFNLKVGDKHYLINEPVIGELIILKDHDSFTFEGGRFKAFGINTFADGKYHNGTKKYSFQVKARDASISRIDYSELNKQLHNAGLKIKQGKADADLLISGMANRGSVNINLDWKIQEGAFTIRDKSTVIDHIYANGKYSNEAGKTQLKVDSLYARSDESFLSGNVLIKNLTKPDFRLVLKGNIELKKLMEIEAVSRRFSLNGVLGGEIKLSGILPRTDNIKISDIRNLGIAGQLTISNGEIISRINELPAAKVSGSLKMQDAREILLENVLLKTGESDLLINGKVMHLPFLTGNAAVFPRYHCSVSSQNLRIDDLMVETKSNDNNAQKMIQLPDSLRFLANVHINKFSFGKFTASDVDGDVVYNPKTLTVHGFSMHSQGGIMQSDLTLYQKAEKISADIDAKFDKVDIGDMFYAFNNFRQNVIVAENIDGTLSGNAKVHAAWDIYLNPFLDDLDVSTQLLITNGELIDYQPMLGLSRFINVDELRHIRFDKLETSVSINDQTVSIPQTTINSTAISLTASGEHNFENEYRYRTQVQLSDVLWHKARKKKPENNEFGYVVDDGLGRTALPLVIEGKGTDFEVRYDKRTAGKNFRNHLKKEGDTWRQLLGKEEGKEKADTSSVRIRWEDEVPENRNETFEKEKINNPSGQGKDTENNEGKPEFLIEWDDE